MRWAWTVSTTRHPRYLHPVPNSEGGRSVWPLWFVFSLSAETNHENDNSSRRGARRPRTRRGQKQKPEHRGTEACLRPPLRDGPGGLRHRQAGSNTEAAWTSGAAGSSTSTSPSTAATGAELGSRLSELPGDVTRSCLDRLSHLVRPLPQRGGERRERGRLPVLPSSSTSARQREPLRQHARPRPRVPRRP